MNSLDWLIFLRDKIFFRCGFVKCNQWGYFGWQLLFEFLFVFLVVDDLLVFYVDVMGVLMLFDGILFVVRVLVFFVEEV